MKIENPGVGVVNNKNFKLPAKNKVTAIYKSDL